MKVRYSLSIIALIILFCLAVAVIVYYALRPHQPALHLYTWADYVKPELVERFEREHRCHVVIDTFDSNEAMYAKLEAGAGGYDVITPSSYMVTLMQRKGMLQPIQRDLVPNIAAMDPEYLKGAVDKAMAYSVPYMVTSAGIAYQKAEVKDAQPTWAMFERAGLKGRMTMLDDMRETLGAALKFLGYSLNSTDEKQLAEARDVVLRWRANLAKFENEQYKSGIASREFLLVHGYGGDLLQVRRDNAGIEVVLPKEGYALTTDDLVIPAGATQVALAHAWINFIHDPKVAAENMEFVQYWCPNTACYPFLDAKTRADPVLFPPADLRAKGEEVLFLDDADRAKYARVWEEIKSGK